MKKCLFIFFCILFVINLFSQEYHYIPFPDSGAVWSEVYLPPLNEDGIYPPPIYERFAVNGEDTIINDITYTKLYLFYDSVFNKENATYVGGIREDKNKWVYYKPNKIIHKHKPENYMNSEGEIVLYNFSVGVNDTIWEGNFPSRFPKDNFLIVEQIDTIQINNTLRKVFYIKDYSWVIWIEGIGNVKGLLFSCGDLPTNGLDGDLICFKQNDSLSFFNSYSRYIFSSCFPEIIDDTENIFLQQEVIVYPNPLINDKIIFNFKGFQVSLVEILDSKGSLCEVFKINNLSFFSLLLKKYQTGIYFYKATNKNGKVHTGKLVVQ